MLSVVFVVLNPVCHGELKYELYLIGELYYFTIWMSTVMFVLGISSVIISLNNLSGSLNFSDVTLNNINFIIFEYMF